MFPYFCTIHPAMIATVTVVEAGAELVGEEAATPTVTPQPTATPTPTVTPQPTATPTPTVTPQPTATPTPTVTPQPTTTPTPTVTSVPTPEQVSSNIVDFALRDHTIQVGTTVRWVNVGQFPHTTTAGSPGDLSGQWDSATLQTDGTFSFTFDEVGEFPYFCTIHPSMTATVTVVEG